MHNMYELGKIKCVVDSFIIIIIIKISFEMICHIFFSANNDNSSLIESK